MRTLSCPRCGMETDEVDYGEDLICGPCLLDGEQILLVAFQQAKEDDEQHQ